MGKHLIKIGFIIIGVILIVLLLSPKELNHKNVLRELEGIFGESMVLGVHDMGNGIINATLYVDGAKRNEKTYQDAMVKARNFAYKISKYRKGKLQEINLFIGLRHNVTERNMLAYVEIDTNILKKVDWENINGIDELSKHLKINLE